VVEETVVVALVSGVEDATEIVGGGELGLASLHSHDWGVSLFVQTAERLALRKRGKRIGMRLAEVYAAGLFLYGRKGIGIEMDDLFNEPLAVDIA
jgi:hypothetical protein